MWCMCTVYPVSQGQVQYTFPHKHQNKKLTVHQTISYQRHTLAGHKTTETLSEVELYAVLFKSVWPLTYTMAGFRLHSGGEEKKLASFPGPTQLPLVAVRNFFVHAWGEPGNEAKKKHDMIPHVDNLGPRSRHDPVYIVAGIGLCTCIFTLILTLFCRWQWPIWFLSGTATVLLRGVPLYSCMSSSPDPCRHNGGSDGPG